MEQEYISGFVRGSKVLVNTALKFRSYCDHGLHDHALSDLRPSSSSLPIITSEELLGYEDYQNWWL